MRSKLGQHPAETPASWHSRPSAALEKADRTPTITREGTRGPGASFVLQLQRLAGNRAVGSLLRPEPTRGPATVRRARAGPPQDGLDRNEPLPEVTEGIGAARRDRVSLPAQVTQRASAALRSDLSGVGVHTSADSDLLSRALGARAFTVGADIFFSQGAYDLATLAGRRLVAHELTHVAQQSRGGAPGLQGKLTVSSPGDTAEREADATAERLAPLLDGSTAPSEARVDAGRDQPSSATSGMASGPVGGDLSRLSTQPSGALHRAVGFEFQTGWGIVRSLPGVPAPLNTRAADPDATRQTDWEDEQIHHTATPAPVQAPAPQLSWQQRLRNRIRRILGGNVQPPAPTFLPPVPAQDGSTWASPTQYRHRDLSGEVTRPGVGREHFKLFKPQVIKTYQGFQLTVDDATTPLGAEVEWVIHPPIEESRPLTDAEGIARSLVTTVNQLVAYGANRESFLLSEVTHDNADATIEFQPGIKGNNMRSMAAQAQVTGGVSMDRLHRLFEDMGRQGQPRTALAGRAQGEMSSAGAPAAAQAASVADQVGGSARLKGLVAFIYRYLAMASTAYNAQQMNYPKVATMFLARTDFNQMFRMLPTNERQQYGGPTFGGSAAAVDRFVRLVQDAVRDAGKPAVLAQEDLAVFQRPIKGGIVINVTRGAWLRGIANGTGDLLGAAFQKAQGDARTAAHLESMGNLGDKRDRVGGDGTARDNFTGIVMEFRGNTSQRDPSTWVDYVKTCFEYLKELNAGR